MVLWNINTRWLNSTFTGVKQTKRDLNIASMIKCMLLRYVAQTDRQFEGKLTAFKKRMQVKNYFILGLKCFQCVKVVM